MWKQACGHFDEKWAHTRTTRVHNHIQDQIDSRDSAICNAEYNWLHSSFAHWFDAFIAATWEGGVGY